ncbi:MAG: hypothetical protein HOH43_01700 [Candidatus Latescibacteria bacterium]|jgi:hypothetical protein|nr:hypothetical protein [Candidatus Latescibacterota bacterium]
MHDAITLEDRGIPCALICTDTFIRTADVTAESLGVKGYPYALVKHPIGRLEPDHLSERIDQAVDEVVRLLRDDLEL